MIKPLFKDLRKNYKTESTQIHTCSMHFPNTCAIRMSEALANTMPDLLATFKKSTKNKCPHGYLRGAQDLASVLAQPYVFGSRSLGWGGNDNAEAPKNVIGKKGIICYMNIPGFDGQGHIDLWDNDMAVGDDYWDAKTI